VLDDLLDELHESGREHDAAQADRLDRLRNIEPESGRLLSVLVRALGAKDVLEIGTSNGVSTLYLADAVAATGGRLVSVELLHERTAMARENLRRAGLSAALLEGDGGAVLRSSSDDSWDFILLDAERPQYPGYWPDLVRVLRPGGLIAADNAISHAEEMVPFRAVVDAHEDAVSALDATGAGLLLVTLG
jgi:predicted O-methyltransferase YrrM